MADIGSILEDFWKKISSEVFTAVIANNYSFLDDFNLPPKELEIVKSLVNHSITENSFPNLIKLFGFLKSKGASTFWETHLKKKGFLQNPGKNNWSFTPSLFSKIAKEMGEELPSLTTKTTEPPKIKKPRRTNRPAATSGHKFSGKMEKIRQYLLNEKVGDELVMGNEDFNRLAATVGTKRVYVSMCLRKLEKLGVLKRKNRFTETGGMTLAFPEPTVKKEEKAVIVGSTVEDLIRESENKINGLKAKSAKILEEIAEESAFLNKLKERAQPTR